MGMAASQARFLGLTARKTNVEYEGQQVNQQRTALSNQSANYYNQLLGMTVPTPPSIQDFTKTVYSFNDGALTNNITSLIAQANGTYLVSYTSSWTDDFAAVSAGSSIITEKELDSSYTPSKTVAANYENATLEKQADDTYAIVIDGKKVEEGIILKDGKYTDKNGIYEYSTSGGNVNKVYSNVYTMTDDDGNVITNSASLINGKYYTHSVGSKELRTLGSITTDDEGNYTGNDEYLKTLSKPQIAKLKTEEDQYVKLLNSQYGNADWQVRYVFNSTTKTYSPYFYKKEDLEKATYSDNGTSQSYIPAYTIGSAQKTEEHKGVPARIEQDSSGRLINITLNPGTDDEITYSLTTNTTTDQAAYDDAMNQYEYDKYQYDQSIQEINAKIEIVQAEDKNLELRLKQLDTEQDAIQTEMDAVQKVIEKNTESTFKTFG